MLNSEFDDSLKFEEKRIFTREQIQQKRIPEIAKIVNSVDFKSSVVQHIHCHWCHGIIMNEKISMLL